MSERDVFFNSAGVQLAGTLATPAEGDKFPAVLLIAGSGMVDRDESHKKFPINALRDLSAYLTEHGIATLRYDKRGVGASEGDYWTTGFYDNVTDAMTALDFLKEQENIMADKVFLLGHSEGALISTRIAGQGTDVAGAILIAGAAHTGEDILVWQGEKVSKSMKGFMKWVIKLLRINVTKNQRKLIDKIKKSTKDKIRVQLIAKINAKWMREFLVYNPADDMPQIKVPVLAITGDKDIQVNPEDLKLMAELIKSPFEYHILSDVTHLLRVEEGEASISTYKKMVLKPLDPRILQLTEEWLQRLINE